MERRTIMVRRVTTVVTNRDKVKLMVAERETT
jgi:hypothetical protein